MKRSAQIFIVAMAFVAFAQTCWGQYPEPQMRQPETIASAIKSTGGFLETDFISLADAMPTEKFSFAPTQGEFKSVRAFSEQVKHVACANFAFFNEIEGKQPPPDCEHGVPDPAKSKAEIMKYLRDSFAYADRVVATIHARKC
jgi:hypothetical protein